VLLSRFDNIEVDFETLAATHEI